ncbi:polysaccharide deacetylase family protein [Sporosarcina sp. ACRSM]|uniref:polysaccharide deacetylase family protein n=1 Tax=Sporosarcina sp. ACRSM TaxID=2918216 RepID=UPI001EF4E0C2|nr:polysaccharide deacetylase family protein [Sporosarcina sp. ACRSM]MCG7336536.1 polysaccharide deacetylase family protein [Sporosarcina sp. ACRSM]
MILVLLIFTLAFPISTHASSVKLVKITETTPVFDDTQKVAVFQKGTSHTVIKESDRFYHTIMGNDEVKFSKQRARVIQNNPGNWKGAHPVRATTSTHVNIMDRPSVKATVLGSIQPKMTIYVQRLKGVYYPILVGGQTGYIHKDQLKIESGIPVLMYHDIVTSKSDQNTSTLEIQKFREQMNYLKKNGWTTITPHQLEAWVTKQIALPKKSVLITFDDGYASTIDLAYPILKQHGFQATSFLITSRINRPGMVSDQDIARTQDVYSYQNHTHVFHMFNNLTNLSLLQYESEYAILEDLQQANGIIEDILGPDYTVTAHAYPYGKRSPQAIRALLSAGITSAYTIDEGNVFQGDSIFELKRQRVHSNMTLKDFANRLEGK